MTDIRLTDKTKLLALLKQKRVWPKDIAKLLNVSQTTVGRYIRLHGLFEQINSDEFRFNRLCSVPTKSGCIEWLGGKYTNGYGEFHYKGKLTGAHRVAYRLQVGEIPKGKEILHSCDNPGCVNTNHLSTGTRVENMQDMNAKGRGNHKAKGRSGSKDMPWTKGSGNSTAKLTEKDIPVIRNQLKTRMAIHIAKDFNVSPSAIDRIKQGVAWRHVA